jgi:hypothetical protein
MLRIGEEGNPLRAADAAFKLAAWKKKEPNTFRTACRNSTGFVFL